MREEILAALKELSLEKNVVVAPVVSSVVNEATEEAVKEVAPVTEEVKTEETPAVETETEE